MAGMLVERASHTGRDSKAVEPIDWALEAVSLCVSLGLEVAERA
jgi:hypothetical protein